MPRRETPDVQELLRRVAFGETPPRRFTARRMIEPKRAMLTVPLSADTLTAVDDWRARRGLSRAEALLALAECGLRTFDHATRRRR